MCASFISLLGNKPHLVHLARRGFYCKPNAMHSFVGVSAASEIFQMHNVVVMIMCLQTVKFQLEL